MSAKDEDRKVKKIATSKTKLRKITISPISNIISIIEYVNILTTENVDFNTEMSKKADDAAGLLPEKVQEEFLGKLKQSSIYRVSKKIYPVEFKLVGVNGSDVQRNLVECIAQVQDLLDRAEAKGELDGYRKINLISLMGALDELCYRIDPVENRILSLSPNQTHLRKNRMAIYTNASKVISLDRKLNGETDQQKVLTTLRRLPSDIQMSIVKDYLLSYFDINWIVDFDEKEIEKMLKIIVSHPDIAVSLTPANLLDLFDRFRARDRQRFLELLATSLSGNEIKILSNLKDKTPS